MSFSITIDQFEGPLDLMLYLIKENKLDLFDLDLVVLTNQYIEYISQMKNNNLQVASEYLSEMAGLIEYKSKKLLPRDTSEIDLADDLDNPQSLVSRLLEYQRFKKASLELSHRYNERLNQLNIPSRMASIQKKLSIDTQYDHDIYDLIKAMSKVLIRHQQLNPQTKVLYQKEFSVDTRIDEIRKYIQSNKHSFSLESLFSNDQIIEYNIVTFLAVLDLIRMNELAYTQINDSILLKGI